MRRGWRFWITCTARRSATLAATASDLVLALIEVESRFDRWRYRRGAVGLMQVMPFWRASWGAESTGAGRAQHPNGLRNLRYYLASRPQLVARVGEYNGTSAATLFPRW